jgi:hypothetical protein
MVVWNRTVNEYGIEPLNLFEQIELVDPCRAKRGEFFVTWCPIIDFVAAKHQLQAGLENGSFPSALSRVARWDYSKGQEITADYLWRGHGD